MFNPETGVFAANKVVRELTKSGAIGYVEKQKKVIFPHTTITEWDVVEENGITFYDYPIQDYEELFARCTAGEKYVVVWDGTRYECVCVEDGGDKCLGNAETFGGFGDNYIGNGEPFFFGIFKHMAFVDSWDNAPHTIAIYQETETTHPIDPKYLPGAVLPVVELSTLVTANAVFTDAESNALTEAFESGMPVVLKCAINTAGSSVEMQADKFNCIAYGATSDGVAFFMLPGTPTMLVLADGAWGVVFE